MRSNDCRWSAPRDLSIRCKLELGVSDSYWQTKPVSRPLTASLDWAEDGGKGLMLIAGLAPK